MIVWFPDPAGDGYRAVEMSQELVRLELVCRPCTVRQPMLQRFVRARGGGPVGVLPFGVKGVGQTASAFHVRDGVLKWRLVCPHGHDTYVSEPDVAAALDAVERGDAPPRVAL